MPIQPCHENGQRGYKYGSEGKCYTGESARYLAEQQAKAIRASQYGRSTKDYLRG